MQHDIPAHAPMTQFPVTDGEICVGGVSLSRLAQRAGGTPFYAYDRAKVASTVADVRAILPTNVRLHYAIKANPMPALLSFLAPLVDGFDVASAGELKMALDTGMDATNIGFAGPGKGEHELRRAIAAGVLINAESERDIRLLSKVAAELCVPARCAIRINPAFDIKSSGMKMGGGASPFGIDEEEVAALLPHLNHPWLAFKGFQIYAGSQNLRGDALAYCLRESYAAVCRLAPLAPKSLVSINLGGGFGIPYFPGEKRLDLGPIATAIGEIAGDAYQRFCNAGIILELGRYLVGEAGLYVTRIVDRKNSRGRTYLVTDGGLNHHLAATGNFGQVLRKNFPLAIGNRMDTPIAASPVSVVGPLCTPLDIIGDKVLLADAQPGDFLVVYQSGAYGASASPQAFLGHPGVTEMLV
jgi:diaminopimelate decarboxylase